MELIKGITIVLHEQKQVDVDNFNMPIYEDSTVEVENVLVAPSSTDDITTSLDLYGKKAIYTLAIPKGDVHNWKDTTVEFFGQKWRTLGYPLEGIEENIPLRWNKKVMVETYG